MFFVESRPAFTIEQCATEMLPAEFIGLRDVGLSEARAFEILFQVILQTKEDGVGEHSSARFQVGIDPCGMRRILLPVRKFVAVSSQQEVHELLPLFKLILRGVDRFTGMFSIFIFSVLSLCGMFRLPVAIRPHR